MLLQLNVHPTRDADLLTPDRITPDPPLAMRSYIDLFGNRVTRVEVPAGLVTFSNRFVIHNSGELDETAPDVRTTPIADLPDDVLLFLVSSRYCDSDKLADFAWSRFGDLSGGARVVQAICDFVHAKIRFSYPDASPTRCASDSMHEGVGVCRDFAHLAIALCRRMNIPARYSRRPRRSDRHQSDGFQRLVRGLSRRALVHERRAPQPSLSSGAKCNLGVTEGARYSFSPSRLCPLETEQKAGVRNGKPDFSLRNQCCRRGCASRRNPPIPASAALSWDAVATPQTSRCRQPSASPTSWVLSW